MNMHILQTLIQDSSYLYQDGKVEVGKNDDKDEYDEIESMHAEAFKAISCKNYQELMKSED